MTFTPQLGGNLLMIGFGAVELFIREGATARSVKPTATDRGTTALIVAAYAVAVVASTTALLPRVDLPAVVPWIGVGVGVAGFAFRTWAMRVLGKFYTRTLITTSEQRVVEEGPYKVVRHPGYLGSLLVWVGAAAASGNLITLIAVTAMLAVAYTHRIRTEERMLVAALGPPYEEYRKRSWRLVPYLF